MIVSEESSDQEEEFEEDEVVWAKIQGYPWWPAYIRQLHPPKQSNSYQFTVVFFGDNTHSRVDRSKIRKFLDSYSEFFDKAKTHKKLKLSIIDAENKLKENGENIAVFENLKMTLTKKPSKQSCRKNINTQQAQKHSQKCPEKMEEESPKNQHQKDITQHKLQTILQPDLSQVKFKSIPTQPKYNHSTKQKHTTSNNHHQSIDIEQPVQYQSIKKSHHFNHNQQQSPKKISNKDKHKINQKKKNSSKNNNKKSYLIRHEQSQHSLSAKQNNNQLPQNSSIIERIKFCLHNRQQLIDVLDSQLIDQSNVKQVLDLGVVQILKNGSPSTKVHSVLEYLKTTLLYKYFPDDKKILKKYQKLQKNKKNSYSRQQKGQQMDQNNVSILQLRKKTVIKLQNILKLKIGELSKDVAIKIQSQIRNRDSSIGTEYKSIAYKILRSLKDCSENLLDVMAELNIQYKFDKID